uniref:Uncharacterized protein n=1 Tax=Panagrolaimus sp. JU765 TaxID=591449 RepID=A0AC34QEW2_9BILA
MWNHFIYDLFHHRESKKSSNQPNPSEYVHANTPQDIQIKVEACKTPEPTHRHFSFFSKRLTTPEAYRHAALTEHS